MGSSAGRDSSSGAATSRPPYLAAPIDGNGEPFEVTHAPIDPTETQPWSGFVPRCTLEDRERCADYPVQRANLIVDEVYAGIRIKSNKWSEMACDEARRSLQHEGGPFGAVVVQVDGTTREVLRYWRNHNQVTATNDPTAHAEVMTIRSACASLGVFDLSAIEKKASRLPQVGDQSYCVIFSSSEPCPMCFSAIRWARIGELYFSATRYDAAVPGVDFSDEDIHAELSQPYNERRMKVYQCSAPNSLDAFNEWKVTPHAGY